MASYKVEWKSSTQKDLKRIDRQYIPKIIEAAESLGSDPFPPRRRKLVGGTGSYRIVYQVDIDTKVVEIFHVRHRKDV